MVLRGNWWREFQGLGFLCRKRLDDMLDHMRDRLTGKLSNASNNAFRLRKLFKMYDAAGSGLVGVLCCPPRAGLPQCGCVCKKPYTCATVMEQT